MRPHLAPSGTSPLASYKEVPPPPPQPLPGIRGFELQAAAIRQQLTNLRSGVIFYFLFFFASLLLWPKREKNADYRDKGRTHSRTQSPSP